MATKIELSIEKVLLDIWKMTGMQFLGRIREIIPNCHLNHVRFSSEPLITVTHFVRLFCIFQVNINQSGASCHIKSWCEWYTIKQPQKTLWSECFRYQQLIFINMDRWIKYEGIQIVCNFMINACHRSELHYWGTSILLQPLRKFIINAITIISLDL